MKVLIAIAALGLASLALAEERRVAVHPLDARELTVEQREWLKAFFDVRLARTVGVRTAGSSRIDEALQTAKGKDCETKDSCLRYLAEATGSLYAVYAGRSCRKRGAAGAGRHRADPDGSRPRTGRRLVGPVA